MTQPYLWPHFSCQQAYDFKCVKNTLRFFKRVLLLSIWFLYDYKQLKNIMHSQGESSLSIAEKNTKRCIKLQLSQSCRSSSDAAPRITSNFHFLNPDLDFLHIWPSLAGVGNLLKNFQRLENQWEKLLIVQGGVGFKVLLNGCLCWGALFCYRVLFIFSWLSRGALHQTYFYLYLNLKVSFYSQSSAKELSHKCVCGGVYVAITILLLVVYST